MGTLGQTGRIKDDSHSRSNHKRLLYTAPRYHTNQHYPIKSLLDAGHEVSFLALNRGHSEKYSVLVPTVLGYSRIYSGLVRLTGRHNWEDLAIRWGFPSLLALWRQVSRFKPNAVIVRNPATAYGVLAVIMSKMVGAHVVFYTQTPKYQKVGWLRRLVWSLAIRLASAAWITPVLGDPDTAPDTSPRLHYVPFVSPPATGPDERQWFRDGAVNILAIGKFQARKNHLLFLGAIKKLASAYPLRATIIGECSTSSHERELARVRAGIRAMDLESIVDIRLNLPFDQVQEQYRDHDLFVLASRDERAAVSPLEAMAHALPVVCSDDSGTLCYIRHGLNGSIFRCGDLEDLVEKIECVIRDRERLMKMGRKSYELVLQNHSLEGYEQALCAIVEPQR